MSGSINAFVQNFGRNAKGQVAILFALCALAIISTVGVAIDYTASVSAKQRMLGALDTAVLAVAKRPDLNDQQALKLAEEMLETQYAGDNIATPDIISLNRVGDTVTLEARAQVPTSFMKLIGQDYVDIHNSAQATQAKRNLDITLVLDNTGSMSGTKLSALKQASNDLVDILYAGEASKQGTKLALVPFAAWVNVGKDAERADWMDRRGQSSQVQGQGSRFDLMRAAGLRFNGCVEARLAPYDVTGTPADKKNPDTLFQPQFPPASDCPDDRQAITPLTNDVAEIRRAIGNMRASGNTNIANGMSWGLHVTSPGAPFTQARPFEDEETRKAIVVLTDGEQTMQRGANSPFGRLNERGPNGKERLKGRNAREALDNKLLDICSEAKAKGIEVYAITFQVRDRPTERTMQACASSPAHYFNVATAAELSPVFQKIASEITDLRLSM